MFDEREAALVDSDHARKCFEDLGIIDRYQSPDKIIAALPTLRASITTTSTLKDRMDMLLSLEYRAARNFYYSPKYRWLFTARQRAHDSAVDKTAAAICNDNPNIIACFGNGCSNLSGIRGRGSRLPVMVCVCVISFPVRANSPFPSQEIREAVERYSREFYLIDEFNTSKVCVLVCLCRRMWLTVLPSQMDPFSLFGMEWTAPKRSVNVFNRGGARRRLSRHRRRYRAFGDRRRDDVYKHRYNFFLIADSSSVTSSGGTQVTFTPRTLGTVKTTPADRKGNNEQSACGLSTSESGTVQKRSTGANINKDTSVDSQSRIHLLRLGLNRDSSACLSIFLRFLARRNGYPVPLQFRRESTKGTLLLMSPFSFSH